MNRRIFAFLTAFTAVVCLGSCTDVDEPENAAKMIADTDNSQISTSDEEITSVEETVSAEEDTLLTDGEVFSSDIEMIPSGLWWAVNEHVPTLDGEARENMKQRLRANFREHNQCLQTGFLGTSILMQTLTDNGMVDIAYDLLFQRRNPSWLYSVDNGATTIWERWNSYTIEHGMAPNGMNSFNHYAYGCVCQWLWQTVAGIRTDIAQPGFRHILLAPVPDKRLGSVNASYQSAAGLIKSEWHYDGDVCMWTFSIPEGTTATVRLPNSEQREYAAGTYTLRID